MGREVAIFICHRVQFKIFPTADKSKQIMTITEKMHRTTPHYLYFLVQKTTCEWKREKQKQNHCLNESKHNLLQPSNLAEERQPQTASQTGTLRLEGYLGAFRSTSSTRILYK